MSLTILSVAYPFAPVGPDAVGGAEQILSRLDSALVAAGHRSIVVAREGSSTAGVLIPTHCPKGIIDDDVRRRVHEAHHLNIERAIEDFAVDLIHFHGIDFHGYLPKSDIPALVTLHLPPSWYPQEKVFALQRPNTWLHCVSRSQRRQCPPCGRLLPEIENGVDIDAFVPRRKGRYALALGRICPEKNFHTAFDAGKLANFPVLIGGQVFDYESHLRYFHEQIEPRLNRSCCFLGPLGNGRKARLLGSAQCLLLPSLAPETSSLVAMEAIAAGTPVIAFRSGALPEIVDHGVTGFLVNDAREMAQAIAASRAIDPEICRTAAHQRFSANRMTQEYFGVYENLVGRSRPAGTVAQAAKSESGVRVETLRTTKELENLYVEWGHLWAEDPHATVFQSPQWLIPWWKHIGEGELFVLAVRADDLTERNRLVGLVPLYVYPQTDGSREIFPLGISTSDYLDALALPQFRAEVARRTGQQLEACTEIWDRCHFPQLCRDSLLDASAVPNSWIDQRDTSEPCLVLPLSATVDALSTVIPRRTFQNFRYARRRAARENRVFVELAMPSNLAEFQDTLIRLNTSRWSGRNGSVGVLDDRRVQRFHAEALPQLLALGVLRMFGLRINGCIAGVHYGFLDLRNGVRKASYYISGFDPDFHRFSPGALLIGHAIEDAVREGARSFDFLRGREAYKYAWGAAEVATVRRTFTRALAPIADGEPS
jgi:CelD/BcsL family acetyltransferase involved in cellulose biosynthesis/glycosyltransferase involved in cell wall biosynthesis